MCVLKEIIVVVCMGGGDLDGNFCLCNVIQEGKVNNVFFDNMECVIKKGMGEFEGVDYEEIIYEGYGFGGFVVFVEVMIDNCNCMVGEVCYVFFCYGGNFGENGCVVWMFDCKGFFIFDVEGMDEEKLMEVVFEVEVEDYLVEDDFFQFFILVDDFYFVGEVFDVMDGIKVVICQIVMILQNIVDFDEDKVKQVFKFMDVMEDQDDVQNVWVNFEVSDEVFVVFEV